MKNSNLVPAELRGKGLWPNVSWKVGGPPETRHGGGRAAVSRDAPCLAQRQGGGVDTHRETERGRDRETEAGAPREVTGTCR